MLFRSYGAEIEASSSFYKHSVPNGTPVNINATALNRRSRQTILATASFAKRHQRPPRRD